jgi:dTDP-4-dehydrorhamnose reductase
MRILLVVLAMLVPAAPYALVTRQWLMRTLVSKFVDGAFQSVPTFLSSARTTNAPAVPTGQDALIVSCGPAGRAMCERLKRDGYRVTVVTTKAARVAQLQQMAHRVFTIPQIETLKDDVLTQCVREADLVLVADAVDIFSAHTFVRTCARLAKVIDRNAWGGTVGLVSSENVYGCPRHGEKLGENASIYATAYRTNSWHVNSNVLALQTRAAENFVTGAARRSFVLRTAGLWDERKFFETAQRTSGAELPLPVRDSFMSFTTTNLVAEATAQMLKRALTGTYNVANLVPMRRGLFLSSLHAVYGMKPTKWVERDVDPDALFSIDADPLRPSSQRANSRLECEKYRRAIMDI